MAVHHKTGTQPPAILLSTKPKRVECAAKGFRYRSYNRHGRLRLKLTCSGLTENSRAQLKLRRPYVRNFAIGNGTGTVRVDVDKPAGDAVPLVSLTTRPRNTDCTAKPKGMRVGGSKFRAEARVTCRGLPDRARGVLAVGGLLAPDHIDVRDPDQKQPPAGAAGSSERFQKPCEDPETFTFEGASVTTRTCYKASITLGPWQTGWIGWPFAPAQAPCRSPWYAQSVLNFLYPPAVDADPWSWWWSYAFGFVTNWRAWTDVNFQWGYTCYQSSLGARGPAPG